MMPTSPALTGRRTSAFSLVELSIVLVILGLLVGGILSGRSLIRAAELRSVGTELQKYTASIQSFKDKYFMLPGDITNASSFWPGATNGDGDGLISAGVEDMPAWQHLANAGLVEGSGYSSYLNLPKGRMPKSTWVFGYTGNVLGSSIFFDGDYGHTFFYSAFTGGATSFPLLTPEDMWNIDTKMDDGMPAIGKVSLHSKPTAKSLCTDAVGTTAAQAATLTANYLLTSTSKCELVFRNAF